MLAAECKGTLDFALEEFKREAKTDKSIKILGKTDKFFYYCLRHDGFRNACGVSSSNIADYRLLNAGEDLWRKGRVY